MEEVEHKQDDLIGKPKEAKNEEQAKIISIFAGKLNIKEEQKKDDTVNVQQQGQLQTSQQFADRLIYPISSLDDKNTQYHKLLESLGNQKFVDKSFPANLCSLVGNNESGREPWKKFVWLRPEQFFKNGFKIIDKVEVDDIKQGILGDCYFLSVLSSLAEKENRIKALFPSLEINPQGCYCVRLCLQGQWHEVIIDDQIPCVDEAKGPAFTKSNGPELWVLLLEKAWAKVHGSYDIIEGGLPNEVMHDMTGAPTKFYVFKPNMKQEIMDEMWRDIKNGEDYNYIMTCDSYKEKKVDSIVPGHAYSLLDAHEFDFKGTKTRLVKIRNPWGKKEWQGNWNDNDARWNEVPEEAKTALEFSKNANDGVFIMDFNEFPQYFENFQICFVNDTFSYTSIKSKFNKRHGKYFKFTINTKGIYFVTANQKSRRLYQGKEQQSKYLPATLTLVMGKKLVQDGSKYQYIEGTQGEDSEVWTAKGIEDQIEPGEYALFIKSKWNCFEDDQDLVVSVYGTEKVNIQETTKAELGGQFLELTYLDHAQKYSKSVKNFAAQKHDDCFLCIDKTDDGFCYIAVWNNGTAEKKSTFNVKTKLILNGTKLKKPFRDDNVEMKVGPGKFAVALIRVESYFKPYGINPKEMKLSFSSA